MLNYRMQHGESHQHAMAQHDAHAILQCLGIFDDDIVPHIQSFPLAPDEGVLACSDGLWNYADSEHEMAAILGEQRDANLLDTCIGLINFANAKGGVDNITAAIFRGEVSR